MKKIFVVDVMAMAFRSFHAFSRRPLSTAKGFPTSALFGSAMFLLKLIEDERPDYLVLACDSKEKNFRHQLYGAYKAQRKEMPADLALQLPEFMRMFSLWGLPIVRLPGYEADDIMGAIAKQWAAADLNCYLVSGDKDFLQLVNGTTFLYAPKKGGLFELLGRDSVHERYGCEPEQVIDIMALWGDSVDNIPGVAGIGEKGATQLIQTFGSLEGLYADLEAVSNKRARECLQRSKDMAFLSRQLVTICTDVPLPLQLEETRCRASELLTSQGFLEFCEEMEFQALSQRIRKWQSSLGVKAVEQGADRPTAKLAAQKKSADPQTPEKPEQPERQASKTAASDPRLVATPEAVAEFFAAIEAQDYFCFDTETTGLDIISDQPIGLSFAFPGSEGAAQSYYLPLVPEHLDGVSPGSLRGPLEKLFKDPAKTKIAHNLKFDLQMLNNLGVKACGPFGDTMLAAFVQDSGRRSYGIDALSLELLGVEKIPTSALIGKKGERPMLSVPLEELVAYACEDADCCFQLYQRLMAELPASLHKVYAEIDMPLVPILAAMEQRGIVLEAGLLAASSASLAQEAQSLMGEIYALAGEEFNINSPKQLQSILYEKLAIPASLGIKRLKKTKNGFSTDISVLETLTAHPLPAKILAYRTVTKLKNTYVDTLPQLVHQKTGRLHTNFHQTGAATGRLSSSQPNMQNIPIRSEKGREIRAAFVGHDRWLIVSADYSQIELRLLAHMADDAGLQAAFAQDQDIHRATAAAMFKRPLAAVTSEERSRAKAINYGIVYGMGSQRLAQATGVTLKEAKAFIDNYFASFPGISHYIEQAIAFARAHGYSETLFGRRRLIAGLDGSLGEMAKVTARNIAINSPIQGSAADLLKIAMIKIQTQLEAKGFQARMLLQVHDELVFECPPAEKEALIALVREGMEGAAVLRVPLNVEIGSGANWLEAH